MPLIGDAAIGLSGLAVAYLIATRTGLAAWTAIVTWNALAIWDAMSALIVSQTNPWPEVFMLRLMGPSMFFAASALHILLIILATRSKTLQHFLGPGPRPVST